MELNLENETSRLQQLNIRKDHCCCKYCGNDLEIRRMTFGTNEDVRITLAIPFSQAPCRVFFLHSNFYLRAHKGAIMALFCYQI